MDRKWKKFIGFKERERATECVKTETEDLLRGAKEFDLDNNERGVAFR